MFENLLLNLNKNENSSEKEAAENAFNMNLLSFVVNKVLKFDTQKQSFNDTYSKKDHLQRFYNENTLNHFVEILTNKFKATQQPLSIVDFCCGYGLPTLQLRERLISNGVLINKIVGYDVSEDLIRQAESKNTFKPQVHFERKNIETDLNDFEEFDAAICLFGLHWINDIQFTIKAIHRSLKPGGLFLSLTPLGMEDLFEFRSKFANSSKWSPALEESARVLHPFHSNENSYIQPLSKLFHPTNSGKKVTKFTFTHSEFLEYLQSWMQEVRHLTNDISHEVRKDAVAKAYVSDLINSIERNLNRNVNIKDDGTVILMHPTCHFDGEKM